MKFSILTNKLIFFLSYFVASIYSFRDWSNDRSAERWNREAKVTLDMLLDQGVNKNIAKNLIMFLGDGMGVSTVTAGRIRKGQLMGYNGEETVTNMEKLPHLALSKVDY